MIGIGSVVGVLGLSESSRWDLLAKLDRLGTNLITVEAGAGFGRGSGTLLDTAVPMLSRIGPVQATAGVSIVPTAFVYRTDRIPAGRTNGIVVHAVDLNLLETLGGSLAEGRFLDEGAFEYPVTVLGSVAAERLGVTTLQRGEVVWLGDQWFGVIGILEEFDLSPNLDRAALVGIPAAETYLDHEYIPTSAYIRTEPQFVDAVMEVIPATANPQHPEEVSVDRPSEALEAREAADAALTQLFLGLGAVSLLVGGVGIANVMVISVLERRGEIGLRRALGATRRHVALQFLGEALLLALVGGIGGVALGSAATLAYANYRGWQALIPPLAVVGGMAATLIIGAIAGLYPAVRAARLSPTEALRSQ